MSGQHPYRQQQPGQSQQPYRPSAPAPYRQPEQPQQPQQRPGQNRPSPPYQQPQQYQQPQSYQQPRPAQPTPVQPDPAASQSVYGVAPPLVQNASLGGSTDRPEPFGAIVALGVLLLALAAVVPFLLFLLTANGASGFEADPTWTLAVPAATAVLTFVLATRVIANGGNRRRPLRALVHLVLGCAVLVLAVSMTVDATGIQFVSY